MSVRRSVLYNKERGVSVETWGVSPMNLQFVVAHIFNSSVVINKIWKKKHLNDFINMFLQIIYNMWKLYYEFF